MAGVRPGLSEDCVDCVFIPTRRVLRARVQRGPRPSRLGTSLDCRPSPTIIAVDSPRIASWTPSAVTEMTRGRGRLTSTQLSRTAVAGGRFRSDPSTAQGRPGSTRTRAGRSRARRATAGLAHALRRVLDLLVDFLGARVDFLGDVLFGFQRGLIHGILDGALADDQQRGLAHVDEVPQLLDV